MFFQFLKHNYHSKSTCLYLYQLDFKRQCMHRTVHLTERQTDPIKLYWQKTNHQRQEEKKQLLLWQYNLQAQHSRIPINLYQCLYLVTRYPVIHCIYLLRDSGVECLVTRIHSAIFCTIEEVDAQVMCYYCSCNLASHLKTSLDLTGYSSQYGQMVDLKIREDQGSFFSALYFSKQFVQKLFHGIFNMYLWCIQKLHQYAFQNTLASIERAVILLC